MSRQLSGVALPRAHDPVRITASLPVSSEITATTACAARSCADVGYVARNDTHPIATPVLAVFGIIAPRLRLLRRVYGAAGVRRGAGPDRAPGEMSSCLRMLASRCA